MTQSAPQAVALHPEGVDRNLNIAHGLEYDLDVALHPEGVDRNHFCGSRFGGCKLSPSTRRAWIEILGFPIAVCLICLSPSTRRAWIEIKLAVMLVFGMPIVALHPEGVDRNESGKYWLAAHFAVALHPEGVDRNKLAIPYSGFETRRPPPGGRG